MNQVCSSLPMKKWNSNVVIKRPFMDRLKSTLSYHVRHKHTDGIAHVMQVRKFHIEAGGQDKLAEIIRDVCRDYAIHHKTMKIQDRAMFASFADDASTYIQ